VTQVTNPRDERDRDLGLARGLSVVSVLWGSVAAVAAVTLGLTSGSLSLIGFGLDSAIDSAASVALVWRFHVERQEPARALRVEHAAERAIGAVLIVAAAALTVGALRAVLAHDGVHPQPAQIVLLIASLVGLPPLALAKVRVATRLGSHALRNDALLTAAAAALAFVALAAIGLSSALGWWWADAAGSVVIAAVLAREGAASLREAARP
jgi:divalent metal cation (Fe/Co/Zn/Cd) transporter